MIQKIERKNAFWNVLSFMIISSLSFINFSLNIKSFSTDKFGLFIIMNSIFGIGSSLDFGFGISTVKHITEALKLKDLTLVNSIFMTFLFLFIFFALLLVTIFSLYYFLLFKNSNLISLNNDIDPNSIYLLLTFTFFFKYISNYLAKVYEGFSKYELLSKINITSALVTTVLMVVIYIYRLNIFYLPLFLLIGSISLLFFLSLFIFLKFEWINLNMKYFDAKLLKKYFSYSVNLQMSFLVSAFIDPLIKYMIGVKLNLSSVTYYETAKKVIDLTNGLISSAQKSLINNLSEENVSGKLKEFVNEKLFFYSKMSNYYSVILYGIFGSILASFVFFWFKSYESMLILMLFFPSYSIINFAGPLYSVLLIEGKGFKLLFIQALNIILIGSILYVSLTFMGNTLGLIGFYFATICNFTLIIYFLYKYNGLNYFLFFRSSKVIDIIILNGLLITFVFFSFFLREYIYYILGCYLLFTTIIFNKYLIFIKQTAVKKFKTVYNRYRFYES